MAALVWRIGSWLRREGGQDLLEYGLLGSLIAVACVAAILAFGGWLGEYWDTIVAEIISALNP